MLMANFLRNRKSSREFRNKDLRENTLKDIKKSMESVLDEASDVNLGFVLYEDGDRIARELDGIGGYAGVMVKSPHYIGIEFKDSEDKTEIYGAYYTEKLLSLINDMGVDGCWLTMTHVDVEKRKEVLGESGGQIGYLLAIGYPPLRNPFELLSEKITGHEGGDTYLSAMGKPEVKKEASRFASTSGSRLGIEKIVFKDSVENPATVEDLDDMGLYDLFYYVRFAPSNRNLQPWRFLVEKNKVKLLMAHSEEAGYSLVDAGVIMYYFESMMKTGHYLGSKSTWELIDGEVEGSETKYRYIAEYNI
ncbi:nitroreductase family protein [Andreesenia angusta]|uniref:Nitroreductase family protein n=1 Tax=Andreesenia angusta TaxID=39480 RepID=A0A1S1VA12_9FIRM|nr:nitroreductase family protein [Andreesenia angusta]OHW63265.1 nitroreductase family protein [Andreesenia angusta]